VIDPTPYARLREAIDLLAAHNKWRRSDDDSAMPSGGTNPMLLGQAIDAIVELVPEFIRKAEAKPQSVNNQGMKS